MKILHVTVGLGVGGAENVMADVVLGLKGLGHDVSVLALKGPGPVGDELKLNGIEVVELGCKGPFDIRVFWRALKYFRGSDFDIIHSHCLFAGVIAALFRCGAPFVWHKHSADPGLARRFFEAVFMFSAKLIIAPSYAVFAAIVNENVELAGRCQVVENGIDIEKWSAAASSVKKISGLNPNKPIFGFVGRAGDPDKGLKFLEAAARKLPDYQFVVVGSKEERRDGNISYFPPVPRGELAGFYASFDALIIPSKVEGLPLVLLEAMACGLPVIAARVGGIPDVIGPENGLLFQRGSVEMLVKALMFFNCNPGLAEKMSAANREKARGYPLGRMVKVVAGAYYRATLPADAGLPAEGRVKLHAGIAGTGL